MDTYYHPKDLARFSDVGKEAPKDGAKGNVKAAAGKLPASGKPGP